MTVTLKSKNVFNFLKSLTVGDIKFLGELSEFSCDESDRSDLVDGLSAMIVGENISYDPSEEKVMVVLPETNGFENVLAFNKSNGDFSFESDENIAMNNLQYEFTESWLIDNFGVFKNLKENNTLKLIKL